MPEFASVTPGKKSEAGSTIPVKILGACAALLLCTMLYNSLGGWHAQSHGQRNAREAALPLQRRIRKSRYRDDPDSPAEVMVEELQNWEGKGIGKGRAASGEAAPPLPPPTPLSAPPALAPFFAPSPRSPARRAVASAALQSCGVGPPGAHRLREPDGCASMGPTALLPHRLAGSL